MPNTLPAMGARAALIEVETSQYVFAHGRRPGGEGHWGFVFSGCAAVLDGGKSSVVEFAPAPDHRPLLYSAAKKWAQLRAVELDAGRVRVAT